MSRALLFAAVLAALWVPAIAGAQTAAAPATTQLTVTGQGTVEAKPDRVQVTYVLSRIAATRDAARASVATRSRRLLSRLTAVGVDPLGVRLSDVEVVRRSQHKTLHRPYRAVGTVVARTDRVSLAGQLLDLATGIGADVSGPDYDLVDDSAAREQATAKAVADAHGRAEAVAAGLGLTIVDVKSISLDDASPPPVPLESAALAKSSHGDTSTPTAPGTETVDASVTVVFDLAPAPS